MAKKPAAARETARPAPPPKPMPPPPTLGEVVMLPVEQLHRHERNARQIPVTNEQRDALIASVRAVGVLNPVLVEQFDGGNYGVIAGWQRVCAAGAVGFQSVPAIVVDGSPETMDRLSVVENALRTPMHLLDQWRTVTTLMAGGAKFEDAAATVGVSTRVAQQMRLLSKMAPEMLEAMLHHGIPAEQWLGRIANASHERQIEGLAAGARKQGKTTTLDWYQVAAACKLTRIARKAALFNAAKSSVVFERDFFAQPGSEDEWTTTDIKGFLAAQREHLEQMVAQNPFAEIHPWNEHHGGPVAPQGYSMPKWLPDVPKEVPKLPEDGSQRFVVAMSESGEVRARIYMVQVARETDHADIPESPAPVAKPTRLITDAGLQAAAEMKREAFDAALLDLASRGEDIAIARMLELLLRALAALNVSPGAANKNAALEELDAIAARGEAPSFVALATIAAETLGEMLVFQAPKIWNHSGPIADDLARRVEAQHFLPRFDTKEFLAHCTGAMLRQAALLVERQPGQKVPTGVAALRDYIEGKLPDWKPVGFDQGEPLAEPEPDFKEVDE